MIQATGVEHPNPREQFITDLGHFLCTTLGKDDKLILVGDFNSTIEDSEGLQSLQLEFQLTDVLAHSIGRTDVNTYIRGTRRIDFALCLATVTSSLDQGGCKAIQYRTKGDHRAFFLNFTTIALFGNPTSLAPKQMRKLQSNDMRNRQQYILRRHQFLQDINFN
jgi:hypothetical protein